MDSLDLTLRLTLTFPKIVIILRAIMPSLRQNLGFKLTYSSNPNPWLQ